jgi:hypothetical protein
MNVWRRSARLLVVTACAAAVAGCGSSSTGRPSADAVQATIRDVAGPDAKIFAGRAAIRSADDGEWRWIVLLSACRPEGGCRIVAPDGADYPDVQHFVDDSELIERGDKVLANANLRTPEVPGRFESFTKPLVPPWIWPTAAAALTALLLLLVLRIVRARRRRAEDRALLQAWEEPEADR